ncbi:MAG: hypothetical protein FLDDKLPJ_01195 [Phycisphaerae bacterium]|nr:hypothetical protein [Phycisphaerae bacterium]
MADTLEFREYRAGDAGYGERLSSVLSDAGWAGTGSPREVMHWVERAFDRGVRLEPVTICRRGARLLGGAVGVDMPGGSALLVIGAGGQERGAVCAGLASRQVSALGSRRCKLIEALTSPDDAAMSGAFARSGFTFLTRLTFLYLPVSGVQTGREVPPLRWESYSAQTHPRFVDLLRRTYLDSADCPELTRLRTAEEALQTHRGASDSGTEGWALGCEDHQDVAVLLTSHHARLGLTEVNYMGVVPERRGRRVAEATILEAADRARAVSATMLSLAVDRRNLAARKLYDRLGFREAEAKDAWLLPLRAARPEGDGEVVHSM